MRWQGKSLEEYNKQELMAIIEALAKMMKSQSDRSTKDLEVLSG